MMEKKELKHEIDVLIESIKNQADRMNAQSNLSMVELEVLHHKIQKLYEKSILIHHLPAAETKVAETITVPQPVIYKEIPVRREEPLPEVPKKIPQADPEPSPMPVSKTTLESKTAVDLFGENATSEPKLVVKAKLEKEKGSSMRKPVVDLLKAIGINDKFRYINELFDGNSNEYNIAINQINACSEYTDADRYVANIREIYHWSDESEVVSLFMDLVERRFL